MATLSGFPSFEVQFTKDGKVHDRAEVAALTAFLAADPPPVTDLLVVSHGWNNDMQEARELYKELIGNVRAGLDAGWVDGIGEREIAVLAVLWPAKKFAEKELIPSGAASAASLVSNAALRDELDDLKKLFDDPRASRKLAKARKLVPDLETDPDARQEFADLLRSLLPEEESGEEAPPEWHTLDGDELLQRLARPVMEPGDEPPPDFEHGGAANVGRAEAGSGGAPEAAAAGLFGAIAGGVRGGARQLMNLVTYYEMKDRAGIVGAKGLNPILRQVRKDHPDLRLHLAGHSFGARLVTSAVAGATPDAALTVDSLVLLQAAFSHYGFAKNYERNKDGFFRRVIADKLVAGPIVISHSVKDRAVGLAYPLASLVAGHEAAALGDRNDPYGGLGRNGAQRTPEVTDSILRETGGEAYRFAAGTVYNLNGDAIITDHGDVRRKEVAFALLAAVAAT